MFSSRHSELPAVSHFKYQSSKKICYEQYQLREEGGVGDAGGKREAANKPDQGEGYRAARGRAALIAMPKQCRILWRKTKLKTIQTTFLKLTV